MDENKLNIETVDGHNELVVSFLSIMVSLSDEEKQWWNDYHSEVFLTMAPSLQGKELLWLEQATAAI